MSNSSAIVSRYVSVSGKWKPVSRKYTGTGSAAENLELLELDLSDIEGSGW